METAKELLVNVLPYVVGAYEAIVRIKPTKKDRSVIGNVLKALVFISNFLNNQRK